MDTKPRHRWFRFSLRTLFLLVALAAVWLGSVTSQVRERKSALRELGARGLQIWTALDWSTNAAGFSSGSPVAEISFIRRWLGDQAIQTIEYFPDSRLSDAETDRLERLFPEAQITCGDQVFSILIMDGDPSHRG